MAENKTQPNQVSLDSYLSTLSDKRKEEAGQLIALMQDISGETPVMWGPSIIGFGSVHYKYDTGREGDIPHLGFSPRKASITIYFNEGFDRYNQHLKKLGKHTSSVSCLYIKKLEDINKETLRQMLEESFQLYGTSAQNKPTTVQEYIDRIPTAARPQFDNLRQIVKDLLPDAREVLSYSIIGYKTDDKRARVYISGWKDHVAMYPIPKNKELQGQLKPYVKGKGTLWFPLDKPLPQELIQETVKALIH